MDRMDTMVYFHDLFLGYYQWKSNRFLQKLKGLRQEDPFSPYLFVLGMEVFSLLVDKAKLGGFLTSYNIRGINGVTMNISHLLFVDDALVFYKDFEEKMMFLSWIMLCFEVLSGLRVKLEKRGYSTSG